MDMSGSFPHEFEATNVTVGALHVIDSERIWNATPVSGLTLDFNGVPGDRHYGRTRRLKPYESPDLAGLVVANDRQVSVVETDDVLAIAEYLGLSLADISEAAGMSIEEFMAGQLAANILLQSGGRSLRPAAQLGSVLVFGEHAKDNPAPSVKIAGYNPTCNKPVKKLSNSLDGFGISHSFAELSARFKTVAEARRGWVGSVYSPGSIVAQQSVTILRPIDTPELV